MTDLSVKAFKTESDENINKVLNGEIDYNDLHYDDKNEVVKGYFFFAQALYIRYFGENATPKCSASNSNCIKEKCPLYVEIDLGWICREYKVIFDNICIDAMDTMRIILNKQILEESKRRGVSIDSLVIE